MQLKLEQYKLFDIVLIFNLKIQVNMLDGLNGPIDLSLKNNEVIQLEPRAFLQFFIGRRPRSVNFYLNRLI